MREPSYVQGGEGRSDEEVQAHGDTSFTAFLVICALAFVGALIFLLTR